MGKISLFWSIIIRRTIMNFILVVFILLVNTLVKCEPKNWLVTGLLLPNLPVWCRECSHLEGLPFHSYASLCGQKFLWSTNFSATVLKRNRDGVTILSAQMHLSCSPQRVKTHLYNCKCWRVFVCFHIWLELRSAGGMKMKKKEVTQWLLNSVASKNFPNHEMTRSWKTTDLKQVMSICRELLASKHEYQIRICDVCPMRL